MTESIFQHRSTRIPQDPHPILLSKQCFLQSIFVQSVLCSLHAFQLVLLPQVIFHFVPLNVRRRSIILQVVIFHLCHQSKAFSSTTTAADPARSMVLLETLQPSSLDNAKEFQRRQLSVMIVQGNAQAPSNAFHNANNIMHPAVARAQLLVQDKFQKLQRNRCSTAFHARHVPADCNHISNHRHRQACQHALLCRFTTQHHASFPMFPLRRKTTKNHAFLLILLDAMTGKAFVRVAAITTASWKRKTKSKHMSGILLHLCVLWQMQIRRHNHVVISSSHLLQLQLRNISFSKKHRNKTQNQK